jgi:hypothetical protein
MLSYKQLKALYPGKAKMLNSFQSIGGIYRPESTRMELAKERKRARKEERRRLKKMKKKTKMDMNRIMQEYYKQDAKKMEMGSPPPSPSQPPMRTKKRTIAIEVPKPKAPKKKAKETPSKKAAPKTGLWKETVSSLKKMCRERGLTKYSSLKKAELIELLEKNPPPNGPEPKKGREEYTKMTVAELRILAKVSNIKIPKGTRKAGIIDLLMD